MNDALAHRGPDAEGLWRAAARALGHRRLSIIDLEPRGQPAAAQRGRDGRRRRQRRDLQLRRAARGSRRRGPRLPIRERQRGRRSPLRRDGARLRRPGSGMFAFALWDARAASGSSSRATAPARSRSSTGACPAADLAFASELHALVRALPDVPATPDLEAIDEYLTLQYVPGPAHRVSRRLQARTPRTSRSSSDGELVAASATGRSRAAPSSRERRGPGPRAPQAPRARPCAAGSWPTCRSARSSRAGSTARRSSR